NDPDTPTARVIALDQTMVHEFLAPIGQSFWVQRATAPIDLAGTVVTIADIAPATDRYNMTLVEIPAALGDPVSPLVAITDPIDGSTVSGTAVKVTATASDNVGVVGVQFKLDGVNLGAEDT